MITDSLRAAIEALHQAIADEPDPKHKQILSQCLQQMMRVQAEAHQQTQDTGNGSGGGGIREALMQQLGAGGGGY